MPGKTLRVRPSTHKSGMAEYTCLGHKLAVHSDVVASLATIGARCSVNALCARTVLKPSMGTSKLYL